MHSRIQAFALAAALALGGAPPAPAATFDVPSVPYPTLQDAVDAAALSLDVDNVIRIVASPITVHAAVNFGVAFNQDRRVVVKPGTTLSRATVASDTPNQAIVQMIGFGGGYVTLQDLDLVRNITNNYHLILLSQYSNVVIQRCRIGSIWTTPGGFGWSAVEISYPYDVTVMNCIVFAYARGTLDRGIHAYSFIDSDNALILDNNVVADHRLLGVDIEATAPDALVMLRNNVVSNHPDFAVASEPVAYHSDVSANPLVVSSHNVAFASAGHVETFGFGGVQSIAGAGSFLVFPRASVDPAFVERSWTLALPPDPNKDFFRLEPAGPLHDQNSDWGVTLGLGSPDPNDVPVVDDIERQGRPGGAVPHTDRGADQIEAGASAGVGDVVAAGLLWAEPRTNPTTSPEIRFTVAREGALRFELFDLEGRRLHDETRAVATGAAGTFRSTNVTSAGIVLYRLTWKGFDGAAATVTGRIVRLR